MKKETQSQLNSLLPKWYNVSERVDFLHYLIQSKKGYVNNTTLRLLFGAKTKEVMTCLEETKEINRCQNFFFVNI